MVNMTEATFDINHERIMLGVNRFLVERHWPLGVSIVSKKMCNLLRCHAGYGQFRKPVLRKESDILGLNTCRGRPTQEFA